jgi:hypothetical protein
MHASRAHIACRNPARTLALNASGMHMEKAERSEVGVSPGSLLLRQLLPQCCHLIQQPRLSQAHLVL